ncbi:MAG: hypothetical protein GF308_00885 [Candidatus Heimdallarchaeota archaeon]|nr:hypothetical protein [Candidatus Heimdallarchaeota archaeon]
MLGLYKKSLDDSLEEYLEVIREREKNTISFYNNFLKNLIRKYDDKIENLRWTSNQIDLIRRIKKSSRDKFRVLAIDGTNEKQEFKDIVVFFGGALGVTAEIELDKDPLIVRYEPYSLHDDLSIIAYAPIPLAMLSLTSQDLLDIYSDDMKIKQSRMDLQLMLLSEIYFAYRALTGGSPSTRFDMILFDNSIGGILNTHGIGYEEVENGIIGYEEMNSDRPLTKGDFFIAMAQPFSSTLEIPTSKVYSIREFILRLLFESEEKKLTFSKIINSVNISRNIDPASSNAYQINDIKKQLERYKDSGIVSYEDNEVIISDQYKNSWAFTKRLFTFICDKVFREKDCQFLKYQKRTINPITEEEEIVSKWFTRGDLSFLISVGIRMVIEKAWENNTLLIGVAKDSASQYFTRNFISVMKHIGKYDFEKEPILPTDRGILELLPFIDDSIKSPYASIEYDACFMTLKRWPSEETNQWELHGAKRNLVTPSERLLARSLVNLFTLQMGESLDPIVSSVLFLDRLIHPDLDSSMLKRGKEIIIQRIDNKKNRDVFGPINPILNYNNNDDNLAQDLIIFLLTILTSNKYAKQLGYPDPLLKAHDYITSIKKEIKKTIAGSALKLRSNPLKYTRRTLRSGN